MNVAKNSRNHTEDAALARAAHAGDEAAFAALVRRYRRELHIHCYRMPGSFHDAEDLVQETFLKAWRGLEGYEGGSFRAWLYRIATNACLDFIARTRCRVGRPMREAAAPGVPAPPPHIPWLEPYPDRLLDEAAPREHEPDSRVIARETIEFAFLVTLQLLPPRQRAALILCDVLDWPAKDAAELRETSAAAVNGALQRARSTLKQHRAAGVLDQGAAGTEPGGQERELLRRYVHASERGDPAAIVALLREDVRCSMPPQPWTAVGPDALVDAGSKPGSARPRWAAHVACSRARTACRRSRPTSASRASRSSGRSPWTCCASRTAASRRSPSSRSSPLSSC